MSFSTYSFVFAFLPIVLIIYLTILYNNMHKASLYYIACVSIIFYYMLDGNNIFIIIGIISTNYIISILIYRFAQEQNNYSYYFLSGGILINLLIFFYLKEFNLTTSTDDLLIPIGVSFIIVQQVMFLVYTYEQDQAVKPVHEFGVFSLFFGYIIAGPVVRKNEIFDQYKSISFQKCSDNFLPALTLFAIGLFKKVVFADNIDPHVDEVFSRAMTGESLSLFDAWAGATLFTMQIYFDFSGYTDMAIGIAGLFGMSLPRNFHSPLKATSIMQFWRCWHRTMTRFFIDFVYVPLAVKMTRIAIKRRIAGTTALMLRLVLPLVATFLVVGIWAGAAPTFVAFALIMGGAIAVNHAWRTVSPRQLPTPIAWLLTILVVIFTLVLDRAPDFEIAKTVWLSMLGLQSSAVTALDIPTASLMLVFCGAFVLLMPNSNEIMSQSSIILRDSWDSDEEWSSFYTWSPNTTGVVFTALVFLFGLLFVTKAEDFIYYRF